MGTQDAGSILQGIQERRRQAEEEHARRMAEDPAYQAAQERLEAARRAEDEAARRQMEAERRRGAEEARRSKGIPARFWDDLDGLRYGGTAAAPPSLAMALGWVERFLTGQQGWAFLFLAGPPGVGKTTAACRFLDAPRQEADPFGSAPRFREAVGRFVTMEQLARSSTYDKAAWRELQTTPRLVIDDVGAEQLDSAGWALANLTALLAARHADVLPTLITMNLTRKAFLDRYATQDGGRLKDRLTEAAMVVELEGRSLRRQLTLDTSEATQGQGA